ncbi:Listeria-Bacteroides repeat domain [Bacteroidales bacterium Barb6XT]|nr:Listeria-Bacteroides repeat domain [Bacteroidales bacterium Barb6XT]
MSPSFTPHIPKGSEENYGYAGDGSASDYWQGFPIAPNYYAVTADGNYWKEGNVSGNSRERDFAYGTDRFLEAVPAEGYRFAKWTNAAGDSLSAQNPYTFRVEGETEMQAHFARSLYRVSLSAAGHGEVSSEGGVYPYYAEVEAEAFPDAGYYFTKWTDEAGKLVSSMNPYVFAAKSSMALRAHFVANPYQVSLSAENGRIKSGDGAYSRGATVKIEAEGDAGYHFEKWTDGEGNSVSAANPYTFALKGWTELTAVFAKEGNEPLTGSTPNRVVRGVLCGRCAASCQSGRVFHFSQHDEGGKGTAIYGGQR